MMESTDTANKQIGATKIRTIYGTKLATLIENGNRSAIKLARLLAQKGQHIRAGSTTDPALLESIDNNINLLASKLGLETDTSGVELAGMLAMAVSPANFNSAKQFKRNLTEGLLLNITTMASDCLAIPSGKYVVWTTDPGHTMLVPTNEDVSSNDMVRDCLPEYDVVTTDLVSCWNKIERVLGEALRSSDETHDYEHPASGSERVGRPSLKKKVEAAGGVRATSSRTGLSPGDVSKHVNNREFDISGDSARAYIDGIGAEPDDIFKYGDIKVWDYDSSDDDEDDGGNKKTNRNKDKYR